MNEERLIELPYKFNSLEPAISEKVMRWHHDVHHQGYVDGMNKAERELEKQRENNDFSSTGTLLRDYTHNFCGNILHNLFWKNMSPDGGGMPDGELLDRIEEEYGSYENWKKEFVEAAKSASGWALLVYVPYTNSLHNVAVDKHDEHALWGAHPILALDVWEHSYYHDYGPERGEFIESFFDVVEWSSVSERYAEMESLFE